MDENLKKEYLDYLLQFVSRNKQRRFGEIIQCRTRHITIVLEDIYQSHNASAVVRSCDCFGIQDIHIIENKHSFSVNPDITLGSTKWLNIIKHSGQEENTKDCLAALKEKGYVIVATSPHREDYLLNDLPLNRKTALLFGTELNGLSTAALEMADCSVRIPMVGFTESFNISVSAAICLYDLTQRLRKSMINWQLSDAEKIDTLIQWTSQVVKKPHAYEKEFMNLRMRS
ncbi:MAG TPA: RNA methyltransferase [Bacteroidales bacterium]|nr:RNA methyltransferase [Bacteroidales bacterium]HNS47099.1 RNA methyltransferase [Bacteroidales bacterium]